MIDVNKLLGVEPDNKKRRISIGILSGVIGATFVMMAFMYNLNSFGATMLSANPNIRETMVQSQNISIFLLFLYCLFLSSDLYYILLPWKRTTKTG